MAKHIKAIKCPNCGSVDKTEIKPDYFKCNSCQTEYFLDNDDVNINYNHNYNSSFLETLKKHKKTLIYIACGFFLLFILPSIITGLFSSNKQPVSNDSAYSVREEEKEVIDQGFSSSFGNSIIFLQGKSQEPVTLIVEGRRYKARENELKNGLYYAFYSPTKKKLLAEQKFSDDTDDSYKIKFKRLSDGNIYTIDKQSRIFKVDENDLKLVDMDDQFFAKVKGLEVGVAKLEFVRDSYGDGFILTTNENKVRYFYPLIGKLYTEKEFYQVSGGFNNMLANAKNTTFHLFTNESTYYPEDLRQLLKVTYKDNGAGPKEIISHVSWNKDYGGSGIFTDRDPYKKVLISDYRKQNSRILNWKDITPGRLYLKPSIVLDEGDDLVIKFDTDASEKPVIKLQKLSNTDGKVEWTSTIPKGMSIKALKRYKNGFIGVYGDGTLLFDAKGNITTDFKIE